MAIAMAKTTCSSDSEKDHTSYLTPHAPSLAVTLGEPALRLHNLQSYRLLIDDLYLELPVADDRYSSVRWEDVRKATSHGNILARNPDWRRPSSIACRKFSQSGFVPKSGE
jgi:hypothetical protein